MPQTFSKSGPELAIRLESQSIYNNPGDTIIGTVVRKEPTVSPKALVTIKLYGRAKSKDTVRQGNTSREYSGCFNLLSEGDIFEKLFEGPVHIPPEGGAQSWPFALTIPMAPSPRSVISWHTKEYSYLPLDAATIAASSLPASFAAIDCGWGDVQAYVEYYLEAQFRQETHSAAQFLSHSAVPHVSTSNATLPILLQGDSLPYPLEDFRLQKRIFPGSIKSQHLVPGMENSELSFHQQMRQFLGSSKVPEFHFNVHVEYPGVIQLQNPNPIPFKIHIVPDRERTSDILKDISYTLEITSLTMAIISGTSIICSGGSSPHRAYDSNKHKFAKKKTVLGLPDSINIQSGSDSKAFDIGASLDLNLLSEHVTVRGKKMDRFRRIVPSFITYNIKHSHQLKWELDLELSGESTRITSQMPVSVLAASLK